jgi:FkbM family methyltransferase
MEQKSHRFKLHWLSWQPTPYNDQLFHALACDPGLDLTVHFRERVIPSHPWKAKLAQRYPARFYKKVLGVDWHVVLIALRERHSFFVIAGWDHPTAILQINLLSLMGRRFAIWTDTPNLTHKRNLLFAFLRSYWLKWVFRKATKVMGTGQPGVEVLRAMGAPQTKLVIFPFFLDLNFFVREIVPFSQIASRPIRFISSGQIKNNIKGHDVALRALALAAQRVEPSFEYCIAGTGPDEEQLKGLAEKLGIDRSVRFLGWLEPDELQRLYRIADILIHPSPVHDPFPNAVLEGMAAGLVVLGSDVSGSVKDRIEHGINGFIHPAGNAQVLAEQIRFLLKNPEKITEVGHKARETAEGWPIERGVEIIKGLLNEAYEADSKQIHGVSFFKKLGLQCKLILASGLTSKLPQIIVSKMFPNYVSFHGLQIAVDDMKGGAKTKCNLLFRMYESAEIRFVLRYLPRNQDVVELGSSIGVLSCLIRRTIAPDRNLVCVEAGHKLCLYVSRNLFRNKLNFKVAVLNNAIVGKTPITGFMGFAESGDNTTGRISSESPDKCADRVLARTLDEIVEQFCLDEYSLVCDIEGAEWEMLQNTEALNKCSLLIIEFHNRFDVCGDSDYMKLVRVVEKKHGLTVIDFYGPVYVFSRGIS